MQPTVALAIAVAAVAILGVAPTASANGAAPVLEEPSVAVTPIPEPSQALDRMLHNGIDRLLADVTREPLGHEAYVDSPALPPTSEIASFPVPGHVRPGHVRPGHVR